MKTMLSILFMALGLSVLAQIKTPSPSPAGSVSSVVGLTDIRIDYSRPRIKGRKVFGEGTGFLVPYGSLWRTGANNGTIISFSDDVTVEGSAVPAGKYLIYTWPGVNQWTVSFYKDLDLEDNYEQYDKTKEAANFKIKPEKMTEKVETLTFSITDLSTDNKTAKIQMTWENTSVRFTIGVDFDEKVMKTIEASMKTSPSPGAYFQAAVYYLENGKDLKQAHEWITKAAYANPKSYLAFYQKAKIEKALGDKASALASSRKSWEEATAAKDRDYVKLNEEFQKSLN